MPNFIEIGGVTRKPLVDLIWNDPVGGGRVSDFPEKTLRRCMVQLYWSYEGVGGCQISRKKALRNT